MHTAVTSSARTPQGEAAGAWNWRLARWGECKVQLDVLRVRTDGPDADLMALLQAPEDASLAGEALQLGLMACSIVQAQLINCITGMSPLGHHS